MQNRVINEAFELLVKEKRSEILIEHKAKTL